MGIRRGRVVAVLLAAVLVGSTVGALAGAAAGASSASARPGAAVTVTVSVGTAFVFTLSSNEVQPGDVVTVTMDDLGDVAHTFTLSPIPNFQFNSSDSTSHIDAFFAVHHPLVNLSVNGTIGETHSQTFTAPTTVAEYEYVCLEPGHFSEGMWGLLGVGEAGSGGAPPATGPGWQVFAIGGGIASLVAATVVLGFVFGQRPGSRHEMAPERLGYPETPTAAPSAPGEPPAPKG